MEETKYRLGDLFLIKHRSDITIGVELHGRKEESIAFDGTPLATLFAPGVTVNLTNNEFKAFTETFLNLANKVWKNFKPKEADSFFSDYDEIYDNKFDAEYSCRIGGKVGQFNLYIEGFPAGNTGRIKLHKRVAESFAFDLIKALDKGE